MQQFRRRQNAVITAVRLDLDTEGFTYKKWGGEQRCKPGDWVVNNEGDTYSVDGDSFEKTYRMVSPGVYQKHGPVWAEQAASSGNIATKEGLSDYQAGDWLVYNDADRVDGYAVKAARFESLYEVASGAKD